MKLSREIAGAVSRNRRFADRQLTQLESGYSLQSPGVSGTGKTAIEYIASVDDQVSADKFVSSSVLRKPSSTAFVSGVSRKAALRIGELNLVASSPAYRVSPKNALGGVFQNLQRAARASRVSRFVQRLAP